MLCLFRVVSGKEEGSQRGDFGTGDLLCVLKQQIRIQKQERELKCDSLLLRVALTATLKRCEALTGGLFGSRNSLKDMQPRSSASHLEVLPELISRGFSGA